RAASRHRRHRGGHRARLTAGPARCASESLGMRPGARRARRTIAITALVGAALGGLVSTNAIATESGPPCVHRVLVVTAMPLELNPILRQAKANPADTVRIN